MRKTIKVTSVAAAALTSAILMGSNTVKADVNNASSVEANNSVKETKVESNTGNQSKSANDSTKVSTDQENQTLILKKKSTEPSSTTETEKDNTGAQKQANNNQQDSQSLHNDLYSDSKIQRKSSGKKGNFSSDVGDGETKEDKDKAHLIHKESQQEVDQKIHEKYEKVINDGDASESDWQNGLPQDSDLESIKDKDGVTVHIGKIEDYEDAAHPLENNTITYDGKENTYTSANGNSSFLGFIRSSNQSRDIHSEDSVHFFEDHGSKWKKIDNNILIKRTIEYQDGYADDGGMEVLPYKDTDGTVGYRTKADGHPQGSEQITWFDFNINEYLVITPEGNIIHAFKTNGKSYDYYSEEAIKGLLGFYSKIDTSLNGKDGVKLFSTGKNGLFLTDGKLVYGIRGLNGSKVSAIDFNTNKENDDIDSQKYQSVLPEGADTEIKVSTTAPSATSDTQFDLWYIETAYKLKDDVSQSIAQIADGLNKKFDSEVQTTSEKQPEDPNKQAKPADGKGTKGDDDTKIDGGKDTKGDDSTKPDDSHDENTTSDAIKNLWSNSQVEHNLRDVKDYARKGLNTLWTTLTNKIFDLYGKSLSIANSEMLLKEVLPKGGGLKEGIAILSSWADLLSEATKDANSVPLYAGLNSHNKIIFSHKKHKGYINLNESTLDTLYVYKKRTKSKKYKLVTSSKEHKGAIAIDKGMLYIQSDKLRSNQLKEFLQLHDIQFNIHIPIGKKVSSNEAVIVINDVYENKDAISKIYQFVTASNKLKYLISNYESFAKDLMRSEIKEEITSKVDQILNKIESKKERKQRKEAKKVYELEKPLIDTWMDSLE